MERKILTVPFEIKKTDEDEKYFTFSGYASTFGNRDMGGDVVVKGAFVESLKKITPKLLWQHKTTEPIGIFEEIYEDDKGLFVSGKMPLDDDLVRGRVKPQMKIGSISQMSIGYSIVDKMIETKDDITTWFLTKLDLYEASLVSIPMNPLANITAMKNFEGIESIKDLNEYFRECGYTINQTESLLAKMRNIIKNSKSEEDRIAKEYISKIADTIKSIKI